MKQFSYAELESATNNFSLSTLVGKGSHGCVHKALLNSTQILAVKKPSLALQALQDNSKLHNEIQILSSLKNNPISPHLVNLLGLTLDPTTHTNLLVMDFMPNSSLHHALHDPKNRPIPWPKRALIALQIAQAIQFLHHNNPPIIHRDVKPSNILFDDKWNAKLADFGLAVRLFGSGQPAGTIGYIDPCYTSPTKLSTKNDVFSFGVVLLEIMSCRRALDVAMDPASIVDWAVPLIKDDRTAEVLDSRVAVRADMQAGIQAMLGIAARCVSPSQRSRPEMREVVSELRNSVSLVERSGRFGLVWRSLVWVGFNRKRRVRKKSSTVVIRCRAEEGEVNSSSGNNNKVSIREVLAEPQ